jgi:hypothetical protein
MTVYLALSRQENFVSSKVVKICPIHHEALVDTRPADTENGPHPGDTENRLVCIACDYENQAAFWNSECVEHHTSMLDCCPCTIADFKPPPRKADDTT